MPDEQTAQKRKSLTIAAVALAVSLLALVAQSAVGSMIEGPLQILAVAALLAAVLTGGQALVMYWRDWYRS